MSAWWLLLIAPATGHVDNDDPVVIIARAALADTGENTP